MAPANLKFADGITYDFFQHHKNYILFQGLLVSQNMSSGVIISTHSLVLQSVTRGQTGNYTCLAVNPRGETMSPMVELKVRCKYHFYCYNLPALSLIINRISNLD